jgi:peptidyl-prolyl cis-trans isomerase A (cyclophilin A)
MSAARPARPALALLPAALLVGCGPDPELVKAKEAAEARVAELERVNGRLEKDADKATARITALERELSAARTAAVLGQLGLQPGEALAAVFETSLGEVRCQLLPEKAPQTVLNFVQLAEGAKAWTPPGGGDKVKKPLYDGTIFHRVIPEFMIQGGDPEGTGRGGPGYEFEDETENGLTFDKPGLLAMANRGPDTNGSQFFITDRSTPNHLDGKHTIFGVCQNLDVVQAIATVEKAPGDKPVTDVVLRKVRLLRGAQAG